MCLDIIEAKAQVNEGATAKVVKELTMEKERIDKNVLMQIEKSKGEVLKLRNILRTEMLLQEANQVFTLV